MKLSRSVSQSVRYLKAYKLRSTLTTLGLVIGVATIIVFVILSAGVQASVLQTVGGDEANLVYTSTKPTDRGGPPIIASGGAPVFTEHDVDQIRQLDDVTHAIPLGTETMSVTHGPQTVDRVRFRVTSPAYFTAVGIEPIVEGEPFASGEPEVVVNQQAASMFADPLEVGDTLVVRGGGTTVNATVVGVVEVQPSVTEQLAGEPPRPRIYGPPEPFNHRTVQRPGTDERQAAFQWVFAVTDEADDTVAVRGAVSTYLAEESDARHLLPSGTEFSVTTSDQWVEYVGDVTATFVAAALAVSVISLVVGATGIANIMFVSVVGRTREIGIMRAIGAQRRDILQLFLVEAGLLGVLGSVLGVVSGVGAAYAATRLLELPFVIEYDWLALALVVGIMVSLLAGAYPARQASRLDPIEALRRE